MGVVGIAKKGFGKALKAHKSRQRARRIKKGKRGPDIKGVKPYSGKVPWYVSATPNTPESRRRVLKTHLGLERTEKIDKAVKDISEGKKKLKHMEATGQAEELKDYKGKGTGSWHRKGFNK